MNYLDEELVRDTVKNAGSKMFSVTFTKKDGSIRKLNGQLVESPPTHKNHNELFSIHLSNGQCVRTANYNKVLRLASQGTIHQIKEFREVN